MCSLVCSLGCVWYLWYLALYGQKIAPDRCSVSFMVVEQQEDILVLPARIFKIIGIWCPSPWGITQASDLLNHFRMVSVQIDQMPSWFPCSSCSSSLTVALITPYISVVCPWRSVCVSSPSSGRNYRSLLQTHETHLPVSKRCEAAQFDLVELDTSHCKCRPLVWNRLIYRLLHEFLKTYRCDV